MTDLDKLREALEMVDAATEPDREIDYAITALFEPERHGKVREWSASLNAVVALTEREMPDWTWGTIAWHNQQLVAENERVRASLVRYGKDGIPDGVMVAAYAKTEIKARLAAFLRARIAEAEAEQQEDVAALTSPRQMADN